MINVLHVISSPRNNYSFSLNLGKTIIKKLINENTPCKLIEKNLINDSPPFLSADQIIALYKNSESRNDREEKALMYSDNAITEVQEADVIVISTPMYNLGIPAILKAWIDQIVRIGVTFTYDSQGIKVGLLCNKKVYLAIASGRIHTNEKRETEFIESHIKIVMKSIGITNFTTLRVEGTAKKNIQELNYDNLMINL